MRGMGVAAALLVLGGCQRADAPAEADAILRVEPSEAMREAFLGCQWGKVDGATLSVWAYDCPADRGDVRLVADDKLPGFSSESTVDGRTVRQPVIIAFTKAADAPVSSILQAVQLRSPGRHTAQCVLAPVLDEGTPDGFYTLEPTGETKALWDRFASGDANATPMDPPCGDMGPQMVGDRRFHVLKSDPTTVLYVDYGSEIQIFDASTVVVRPAG